MGCAASRLCPGWFCRRSAQRRGRTRTGLFEPAHPRGEKLDESAHQLRPHVRGGDRGDDVDRGGGNCGGQEIRSGRQRHRNQDRPDRPAFWPRLALRRARPRRRSLFPDAEREGRHQRPQDQVHHPGRLLQRAEGGGSDPPAGRTRGSAGAVRLARHRASDRGP